MRALPRSVGLVSLAFLCSACASPLDGIWTGTATEVWTCSNGENKTVTADVSLVFNADPGYFAWITPDCGSPEIEMKGNTGDLIGWSCATAWVGTGIYAKPDTWELRTGRFIVDGGTMVGTWSTFHSVGQPEEYHCSTDVSGTFTAAK